MSGFLVAGLAALLWSIVNIVDKALVERFCKNEGIGALLVLSGLFPIVLLPISFYFADSTLLLPVTDIAILIFSGILTIAWIYLYLDSLNDDDVSIVMPLMQLTPVFALIFGFLFLGEWLDWTKLLAVAVVVTGALVLSIEQTNGQVKRKLLLYMAGASAIIALMNTLFKFATIEETFWVSIFWRSLGIVLTGSCLYFFHKEYRKRFNSFIRNNWGVGLSLNTLNETLTIVGDILFTYAILLAPLALIQSMGAWQPIFVLIIGLTITKFAPNVINEDLSKKILLQKIIGITLVIIGSVWLTFHK